MPAITTLATLKTKVLQRADMVNSTFIDTATGGELENYIKGSMEDLYDLIIENGGMEYNLRQFTIPIVAGTQNYTVPAAGSTICYKIHQVGITWDGKKRIIKRATLAEVYDLEDISGWPDWSTIRYAETGVDTSTGARGLSFGPIPQAAYEIGVQGVQFPDFLDSGGNFAVAGGWDEYIIVDAAMKCLEKEESDVSHLERRKMRLIERIQHHTRNWNHGDGDSVRDVHKALAYSSNDDPALTLYTA